MSALEIKQRPLTHEPQWPGIEPLLARVLSARGIRNAGECDYSLKHLLPPQGLSHINAAAELLAEAISADATVVIVGDFDADGATSCALAVRCLRAFGLDNVSYLVPNRFEFGYGLSPEIVGMAAMRQPDVIITVDNGISSVAGVHAAQALGMSVLITDHHLPGETLPTAEVIVNPNSPGDTFASKNLAGVGVIFYVMLATRARLRKLGWFQQANISEPNMSQFLDLVALGTVADVVQMDRNNRILVQQGLHRIRQGQACAGITALLEVAQKSATHLTSSDLGFALGPRLNAAGRMDDMSLGIECLLSDDADHALGLAAQLDDLNRTRREVEQSMQQDALKIVDQIALGEAAEPPSIYCLADPQWHQGVVGLVASRVKERTQRPVVAMAPGENEGEWKGSARSVEGLHIRDLLARVDALHPGLMSKFGGHAMAAGFSLPATHKDKFEQALLSVANAVAAGRDWGQVLWTDGALTSDQLRLECAELLLQSQPWGEGFSEPMFEGRFEVLEAREVGIGHAKLKVRSTDGGSVLDAICFGYLVGHAELPQGCVRMVYRMDANEFRGQRTLQLLVRHIEAG